MHYSEIKLAHLFTITKTRTGTLVDITADLIKATRQDHLMVSSALTPPYNPKSILPDQCALGNVAVDDNNITGNECESVI